MDVEAVKPLDVELGTIDTELWLSLIIKVVFCGL
jgi:hypothetical protein